MSGGWTETCLGYKAGEGLYFAKYSPPAGEEGTGHCHLRQKIWKGGKEKIKRKDKGKF